ncbi:unnamed protein product [marine sediment metagenome]|uniref:DUF112 domain-containing protein n=1 Tax=marine sediment metagenome TaxID=412755 RepID=X0ZSY1_9ZZZZ
MEGFSLVPALIGLFAISQMFFEIEIIDIPIVRVKKVKTKLPNFIQIKKIFPTIIRASIIGNIIGAIPGPGAVLGSFVPYQNEKRLSKHPENNNGTTNSIIFLLSPKINIKVISNKKEDNIKPKASNI